METDLHESRVELRVETVVASMVIAFQKGFQCIIGSMTVLQCFSYRRSWKRDRVHRFDWWIHRHAGLSSFRRFHSGKRSCKPDIHILPRLRSYSDFSDLLSSSSGFRTVVWSSVGAYFESFLNLGP